jgi:hypothetical protein
LFGISWIIWIFHWIFHEIAPRSQAIVSTAAWQWIILDGQKVSKRHVSGGHVVHVDVQIDMFFWLVKTT